MDILSGGGILALEMAVAGVDPDSLGAAERMQWYFPPGLAVVALIQVALQRRVQEKLPMMNRMFFTPDELERATRQVATRWHAARFIETGVSDVWNLGCGIRVNTTIFAEAGLGVHAVKLGPAIAVLARASLTLSRDGGVTVGCAEDARVPEGCGTFLDPACCTAQGWTWDVADLTPSWSLMEGHLRRQRVVFIKLGPGLPKQLIPEGIGVAWMSAGGDVVKLMLSNALDPSSRAVVFPRSEPEPHILTGNAAPLPVVPPGRFIHEPDNVIIRAGLMAESASGGWLLAPEMAYVLFDSPTGESFVTSYQVIGALDHDVTTLRRWVKQHRIGWLEIEWRATDIDSAALWK